MAPAEEPEGRNNPPFPDESWVKGVALVAAIAGVFLVAMGNAFPTRPGLRRPLAGNGHQFTKQSQVVDGHLYCTAALATWRARP